MKKVIKKAVAKKSLTKAQMGTVVEPPKVPKKLTIKEKILAKKMSKYDKGRSDKPTSYFHNPYSTIKKPTDYLKKGGTVKKTMVKSKKK